MKHYALLWILTICFSQNGFSQNDSAQRFLNFGLKLGLAHQKAFAPDNQNLKLVLTSNPFLEFESNNIAVSAQLYWQNNFGFAMEIGRRKTIGMVGERGNSGLFRSEAFGNFETESWYVAPTVNYNRALGSQWLLMLNTGLELHQNFSSGRQGSYFDFIEESGYFFDTERNFVNLLASAEIRRQMTDLFWLGFYVNLSQGLHQTAELFYQEDTENVPVSLGKFKGTGFDFGVRLSWCFSCK